MDDNKITIWRYMNPYTFISQLARNEITFVRISKMEDRTESYLKRISLYEKIIPGGRKKADFEKNRKLELHRIKEDASDYYISCWTIDDFENFALWKNYTNCFGGIVIKTTVDKFSRCIPESINLRKKAIKYYPRDKKSIAHNPFNIEERIFSKFSEYSFEKEYRFAIKNDPKLMKLEINSDYLNIPIDFNCLIENLYMSPFMSTFDKQLFEKTIDKININVANKIHPSSF
jgi:hypothetical protein